MPSAKVENQTGTRRTVMRITWGVWQGVDSVSHFNKVKVRFSPNMVSVVPRIPIRIKYAPEERDHDDDLM